MSYSTLIAVWPGKKIELFKELPNSWGTAPIIWDHMFKTYVEDGREKYASWLLKTEKIWPLWRRTDIPEALRAVLLFTCDKMYFAREGYQRASKDIRDFTTWVQTPMGHVNHWKAIADILAADPHVPGMGLWPTSVTENPFRGPYNEELEAYPPLDWSTVFDIYEELDGLKDLENHACDAIRL